MVCSCCWPGLCLLHGSRSELGVGGKAAMGSGDLPQKGSGLCRVGGVRFCAPPQLAPKFSPAGPYATVPVLGCSFSEESYPSLANQPSSGAKQGDVRCASEGGAMPLTGSFLCLLGSRCPCGLHAQHLPWDPLASWRGPRLWSHLREPRFLLQEGPSSQHWARETISMVPACKRHQPHHGQEGPGHSLG